MWQVIPFAIMLLFSSCSNRLPYADQLIFTQVPASQPESADLTSVESKYAPDMKIALSSFSNQTQPIDILTADFFSARSPELSFNGKNLVFSGQKNKGDVWQIWSLEMESRELYQVSQSRTNCTDPAWLPDGKIVFSKLVTDVNSLKYHALFTIGNDGCCEQRITFQPHDDLNSTVMHDGRILVASRQIYPEHGQLKYLALRPDGTKAEVFYIADENAYSLSRAVEKGNDSLFFCEDHSMTSLSFNRPLHSKKTISENVDHAFHYVHAMDSMRLLVAYRRSATATFGISIFDRASGSFEEIIAAISSYHYIEPIYVQQRPVHKVLPSRVNPENEFGYFLSMNADASTIDAHATTAVVQISDMSGIIGQSDVANDGSFYLEVPSDRPLRFQTLDNQGNVLRGPSSWTWVRPNERRACVGCHQDREMTPENIVPLALKDGPKLVNRSMGR